MWILIIIWGILAYNFPVIVWPLTIISLVIYGISWVKFISHR